MRGMRHALTSSSSDSKVKKFGKLRSWKILTDEQTRELLESTSLSDHEKAILSELIGAVGAFEPADTETSHTDDAPF